MNMSFAAAAFCILYSVFCILYSVFVFCILYCMLSVLCDFQGPHLLLRVFKLFQVQNMFRIIEHVQYWIKAQKLKGHINVGLEENNWVQNVNKTVREGTAKGRRITHRKLWTGNEKLLLSCRPQFLCSPPPHICNLIGQILSGGLPVLVPIFHPGKYRGVETDTAHSSLWSITPCGQLDQYHALHVQ